MRKLTGYVIDREGNAVAGAEVYIRDQGDNSLVDLYSDDGSTATSNPLSTDNDGEWSAFFDNNTVKIQIFTEGVQQQEVNNYQHFDLDSITAFGFSLIDDATAGDALTTLGVSAFAQTILDDADAAAARTTLGISNAALALPLTFNFSADGEARFYADVAMTVTEQADSGTGTVAYEKSTNAAPDTFASTSSPIALEAGAWLKVIASGVSGDCYAVHLKRTA